MKIEKTITYIFISFIFFINLHVRINYYYSNKLKKNYKLNLFQEKINNDVKIVKSNKKVTDLSILYPFDNSKNEEDENKISFKIKKKIIEKFNYLKERNKRYEDIFKIYFPFRIEIVTINRFLTGSKKSFVNLDSLASLNNNYYAFIINKKQSFDNEAKQVVELSKTLNKNDINFCSVTYPSKFSKYKPDFPLGIIDYSNYNVDTYLNVLKKNKIDYLDLRENVNNHFKEHLPIFFKSDHHWKPEVAFWATNEIISFLNKKYNMKFNTTLLNKDKYKFTTYPKVFLGSHGKKLTLAFSEPDDLTIIEPTFPTYFEAGDLNKQELKIGSFSEVLLDYKAFYHSVNNPYKGNAYYVYSEIQYIKNQSPNMKNRILIINDSFSIPVIPFLAIVSKEVISIDLRTGNKFSVEKYILDLKPDVVILAYGADRFNRDSYPEHMENMFKFK